ncbi:MAG: ABC transporter ATPase [Bacteroidota bacterium]
MLVNFENLSDTSRVWIYQSNRELSKDEITLISKKLENFIKTWKRHGEDLKASFKIKYGYFIVIAVDESYNPVSGCSIDASTFLIKQIENDFQVELLNKMNTAFKSGDNINIISLADFQKYVKLQKINTETIVFNNMVETKKSFETAWELKAGESWHNRFLN